MRLSCMQSVAKYHTLLARLQYVLDLDEVQSGRLPDLIMWNHLVRHVDLLLGLETGSAALGHSGPTF